MGIALALVASCAQAGEVLVAVASNFTAPMQKIAAAFEAQTAHKAKLVLGSTGSFYTQILNGAPFELFLSADEETVAKLEGEGLAVRGTRFTYATGKLVLWSANPDLVDARGDVLGRDAFGKIAIANPRLAPYGRAAVETMQRLGVFSRLEPKLVQGENIGQAYQFIATGNASLGFVALSQVMADGRIAKGSAWVVPAALHAPIRQDAVVLKAGAANRVAFELANFLKSERARGIIRAYGYQLQ